jgi:hypothetical protein
MLGFIRAMVTSVIQDLSPIRCPPVHGSNDWLIFTSRFQDENHQRSATLAPSHSILLAGVSNLSLIEAAWGSLLNA